MGNFFIGLFMAVLAGIVIAANRARANANSSNADLLEMIEQKRAGFQNKLEAGETLLAVSPNSRDSYCFLTDRRLVIEDKKGTHEVALNDIKKLKGSSPSDGVTNDVNKMTIMQVKADKSYYITKYSQKHFAELAEALMKLKHYA